MINSGKLVRYFRKIDAAFHLHFHELELENCPPLVVDEMLLDLRKQLAFFKWLKYLQPELDLQQIWKPYIRLFRKANLLHDLQTEFQLVQYLEQTKTEEVLEMLSQKSNTARQGVLDCEEAYPLVIFRAVASRVNHAICHLSPGDIQNGTQEYFQGLSQKILGTLQGSQTNIREWHRLRLELRELVLNLYAVNQITPHANLNNYKIDNLNTILSLLDVWHDLDIALFRLDKGVSLPKNTLKEIREREDITEASIKDKLQELPEILSVAIEAVAEVIQKETAFDKTSSKHESFKQKNYNLPFK